MARKPGIDALLNNESWREERKKLRALMLDCGLDEDVKWGKLCYAHEGSNVVIIYAMKAYCALGFFKGALVDDDEGALVAPGKHSQAMRQLRFASLDDIRENEARIKGFIAKAIEVEKKGLKVDFGEKDDLTYPDELGDAMDGDAELAAAFKALTPGRQRGYLLHISDAKNAATRIRRIEKCRSNILRGKGVSER